MINEKQGLIDFDWIEQYSCLPQSCLQLIRDTIDLCILEKSMKKIICPFFKADLVIFPCGIILVHTRQREEEK